MYAQNSSEALSRPPRGLKDSFIQSANKIPQPTTGQSKKVPSLYTNYKSNTLN